MASTGNTKREHRPIEFKYRLILELEAGVKNKDVAKKHGVANNTLSTWFKNREVIKKKFESGNASNESITLKASSFPKTEQQLITWIHAPPISIVAFPLSRSRLGLPLMKSMSMASMHLMGGLIPSRSVTRSYLRG